MRDTSDHPSQPSAARRPLWQRWQSLLTLAAVLCAALLAGCDESSAPIPASTATPTLKATATPTAPTTPTRTVVLSAEPVPPYPKGDVVLASIPYATPVVATLTDDPIPPNQYTLVPDDEVVWFTPSKTELDDIRANDAVTPTSPAPFTLPVRASYAGNDPGWYDPGWQLGAGRIVDPNADQLVAMTKIGYVTDNNCFSIKYGVQGYINPNTSTVSQPVWVPNTCDTQPAQGTDPPSSAEGKPCTTDADCTDEKGAHTCANYIKACIAARDNWWTSPYALAVGDLDWSQDANGVFHDEVVLVTEDGDASLPGSPGSPNVTVLNYSAGNGKITATSQPFPFPEGDASQRLAYPAPAGTGQIHAAIFNPGVILNPDKNNQPERKFYIATLHTSDDAGYTLAAWRYDPTDQVPIRQVAKTGFGYAVGSAPADLIAGDFDGDGVDELAVAYVANSGPGQYQGTLAIYRLDMYSGTLYGGLGQLSYNTFAAPGTVSADCSPACSSKHSGWAFSHADLHAAAGVFKFDPNSGDTLARRQLAITYVQLPLNSNDNYHIVVKVLSIDAAGTPSVDATYTQAIEKTSDTTPINFNLDLSAGNFDGRYASPDDPTWRLALGYPTTVSGKSGLFPAKQYLKMAGTTLTAVNAQNSPSSGAWPARVLAFDYDGDSFVLGPPTVFETSTLQQLLSTIGQPPQHLDYLPNASGSNAQTGILNISRMPGFEVDFTSASSTANTNTRTHQSSVATGASTKASASGDFTEKIPFLEQGEVDIGAMNQLAYTFNSSTTSRTGNTVSLSEQLTVNPSDDDGLTIAEEQMQIWRYRLYGESNQSSTNGTTAPNLFYEVHVPLGATLCTNVSGRSVDDYQPIYENGNMLSYPQINSNNNYTPPDVGSWQPQKLPPACTMEPPQDFTPYSTPRSEPEVLSLGATTLPSYTVSIDQTQTCNNETETKNTINEEGSFEYAWKLTEKEWPVAKETEKINFQLTSKTDTSWSNLATFDSKSTESQSYTIKTPEIDDYLSYKFLPILYYDQSGGLQSAFATEPNGGIWSATDVAAGYGLPDPAFNLPNKFTNAGGAWNVNTKLDARQMRGFYVLDGADVSTSTGLGRILGNAPAWGDQIQLMARVYNYSGGSPNDATISNIPVRFDIADYDSATKTVSNRRTLGTVTADYTDEANHPFGPPLSHIFTPRAIGRAVYNLDTHTLPQPNTFQSDYLVFAVIDPDGTTLKGNETHGWRQANLTVTPYSIGIATVGAELILSVTDDAGTELGPVIVASQGSTSPDIECMAEAFSTTPSTGCAAQIKGHCSATLFQSCDGSNPCPGTETCVLGSGAQIAQAYGISAHANPLPVPPVSATNLIITAGANGVLPASTEFRPTVALASPRGPAGSTTSALHFTPSVKNPQGGTATMNADNLLYGQNNEGFGFLSIQDGAAVNASADAEHDLFMRTDSLGAVSLEGGFETFFARARVGTPMDVRVCGHAKSLHPAYARATVFLGEPTAGGTALAVKRLNGIAGERGSCAWFAWTPKEAGTFTLHAVLAEDADDAHPTNNRVSLAVEVLEAETAAP